MNFSEYTKNLKKHMTGIKNIGTLVGGLFNSAGSNFFPEKSYSTEDSYQRRLYGGYSKLTQDMKGSFSPFNKVGLYKYLYDHIGDSSLMPIAKNFNLLTKYPINKKLFVEALCIQFEKIISDASNDVDNIVPSEYANSINKSKSDIDSTNVEDHVKIYFKKTTMESLRLTRFFNNTDDNGYGLMIKAKRSKIQMFSSLFELYCTLTKKEKIVYLEARGGYGKTYSLLKLYCDLITKNGGTNAVFISARKFIKQENCTMPITRFLNSNVFEKEAHPHNDCDLLLSANSPFVVLIDSLEEADSQIIENLKLEIPILLQKNEKIIFFISGRPHPIYSVTKWMSIDKFLLEATIPLLSNNSVELVFSKNKINDKYSRINKEMQEILRIPLILETFINTTLSVGKTTNTTKYVNKGKIQLKVKKFYTEPVESLIIWNYYHSFTYKYLKTSEYDCGEKALLHLIAYEYVLPGVAYRLVRDNNRYISQQTSLLLINQEIDRLEKQVSIYYKRFQQLPIRIADLNGQNLLVFKSSDAKFSPTFSDRYKSEITDILLRTLSDVIELDDTTAIDHNNKDKGNAPVFAH
ncbi:MAG: hypothetical protein LBM93_04670 [Oscillospiraceae bacterium]|jgi:hypothetical protein|nr:hypothetical protein [Oscillospiraceae bacterium]